MSCDVETRWLGNLVPHPCPELRWPSDGGAHVHDRIHSLAHPFAGFATGTHLHRHGVSSPDGLTDRHIRWRFSPHPHSHDTCHPDCPLHKTSDAITYTCRYLHNHQPIYPHSHHYSYTYRYPHIDFRRHHPTHRNVFGAHSHGDSCPKCPYRLYPI